MHQGFLKTLTEAVVSAVGAELEPGTSTNTDPSGSSPPQVIKTHRQHVTAYTKLIMEGGMELTMGEDRANPLITEVCSPVPSP